MSRQMALAYMAVWGALTLAALIVLVRSRASVVLFSRDYWRLLMQPWKVVAFVVAATLLIVAAPYTGDPTWDYIDATFMAILAFTTAPWAVGVVVRAVRGLGERSQTYAAICVWLFSASWSYDGYLFFRDGEYPVTWWGNLLASSMLYCCAGLMWNLAWTQASGGFFAFSDPPWPRVDSDPAFRRIAWIALAFMVIVGGSLFPFVWPHIKRLLR